MGECKDQAIRELADCSTEAMRRRRLKIGQDRFALAEPTSPALLKHQHLLGNRLVAEITDPPGCSDEWAWQRRLQLNASAKSNTREKLAESSYIADK